MDLASYGHTSIFILVCASSPLQHSNRAAAHAAPRTPRIPANAGPRELLFNSSSAATPPFLGAAPRRVDPATKREQQSSPTTKDGRPPTRVGRLAGTHQLHRARLVNHRDGRARTALLCLETKRRGAPPVLRGQHVVDHVFAPGPRRDPCVERLRRWFCESL